MRLLTLAGCWVVVACAPGPQRLGLPEKGAASLILAVDQHGVLQVQAYDLRATPVLSLDWDLPPGEPLSVWAFSHSAPLSELGLSPGPVSGVAPERCGAQPLSASAHAYLAVVDVGTTEPWVPVGQWPPAIERFRYEGACPCQALELVQALALPSANMAVQEGFDPDRPLLVERGPGASLAWLEPTGLTPIAFGSLPGGLVAAAQPRADLLWVSTTSGVYSGPIGGPLIRARGTEAIDFAEQFWVVGPDELWMVNRDASLGHYEAAGGYASLFSLPGGNSGQDGLIGPAAGGGLWAAVAHQDLLLETEGPRLKRTLPVEYEDSPIRAIAEVAPGDIVLGSGGGRLYRLDGDRLVSFAATPTMGEIRGLLPWEGGLVTFTDHGGAQLYLPDYGFCALQAELADYRFRSGVRRSQDLVLVGVDAQAQGVAVFLR